LLARQGSRAGPGASDAAEIGDFPSVRQPQTTATQLDIPSGQASSGQGAAMTIGDLKRIDSRPISDNRDEIRAFMLVWNDSLRLESSYGGFWVTRFDQAAW
jgi:hypothetical protein